MPPDPSGDLTLNVDWSLNAAGRYHIGSRSDASETLCPRFTLQPNIAPMDFDPDTVGSIPRHLFGAVGEEQICCGSASDSRSDLRWLSNGGPGCRIRKIRSLSPDISCRRCCSAP